MKKMLVLLITSLCCLSAAAAYLPYQVVRLSEPGNSTVYLVMRGVAKAVPNDESVITLGFKPDALDPISLAELLKLNAGPTISSLAYNNQSPDELMRIEIVKSSVFNGELLHGITDVGNYINPSIVKWRGRLLAASCLSVGQSGSKMKPANGNVEFRWLNHTDYPFHTTEPYLGIENEIEGLSSPLTGQDPRIVVINEDKLQVYYTNQLGNRFIRMGMAFIELNKTTNKVEITSNYDAIDPVGNFMSNHKNWSPFIFGSEVLLIQSVNPFMVVKTSALDSERMHAYHESTTEMEEFYWPYGEVRGGTNAIFLPKKGVYLAFLHSAGHVTGMKTYVMGAYTFSAKPPFRILSMSPFPIMPQRFYDGPWHPIRNRRIDYCVFPMGLFVDKDQLFLSFGYQDQRGYLARINVQALWDTLVPVKTKEKNHDPPR